ncbi:MAG: DUF4105 domain-containing protein [Myxococcota bacterium]|nr:DUF4105 domain-containing protein [Myxococcota bacterium]
MANRGTVGGRLLGVLGFLALPWSVGAILLSGGGPEGIAPWRWPVLLAWAAVGILYWRRRRSERRWEVPWVLFLAALLGFAAVQPSQERDWMEYQLRLPWFEIEGDRVRAHEVRNFRYRSTSEWEPAWYDADFRLSELEEAYFVVEHFSDHDFIAHTLVSFRFSGDRFLAFSVELRKERGETYSPLRGLFRQYELVYVVADERDVLQLRTNHRHSRVRIHPIVADADRIEAYFLDLVARTNNLKERPEYYNSVTSSCTTNLADHLEAVTEHRVSFDKRVYLPGYASSLAWELGLLGEGDLDDLLRRDAVTESRVEAARDSEQFSLVIRGGAAPLPSNP